MSFLFLLSDPRMLGWGLTRSKLLAAEAALLNNFIWNDHWTFAHVAKHQTSFGQRVKRFLKFNAICSLGIFFNVAIINNGYLGMVRQWQEFFYERNYAATPLLNPDFAKLAEAYGMKGITVTARSQVIPTVKAVREHNGPVVIDFRVEQEDTVYPMVAAGAALNDMIRRPTPLVETADDE